jgi:hypothetical protein
MGDSFSLKPSKGGAIIAAVVVFCVMTIVPILLIGTYNRTDQSLTAQKETEQQTLVDLTSLALKLKLDSLVGIASSMAQSPKVIADVQAKKWTDAGDVVRDLQNSLTYYDPFIDRVVVYDTAANQQAAYPTLTGGIGTNFASSSWYQAMSAGASFFVSNATKRRTIPQIQIVSIVAPVRSGGAVIGYIVLQIPTNNFLEFGENLSLGTYGFAYVVDSAGNIIANPKYSSDENTQVINYSSISAVKNVIAGRNGTEIANDPSSDEKSLITYQQVPSYGWGIITQIPYDEAFSARDGVLEGIGFLILAACAVDVLVAYMVFRVVQHKGSKKKRHESK